MPVVNFEELHANIIRAKKNGTPISKTLKGLGIPRSTYYKRLNQEGGETWREASEGKIVIKKKTNKKTNNKQKRELGGDSLDYLQK